LFDSNTNEVTLDPVPTNQDSDVVDGVVLIELILTPTPTPTPTHVEIGSCSAIVCPTPAFKCFVGSDKSCTCATWKMFYPKCKRSDLICNGRSGAYVPAITVCNQKLF